MMRCLALAHASATVQVCQTNEALRDSRSSYQRDFIVCAPAPTLHCLSFSRASTTRPDNALSLTTITHPPIMAAATVDVGYVAASYSVPETTLQSLLSEPTVELVQSLLVQIEAKARDYDDLKSEKIKVDVELEAAVQGGDARARTLKAAADKAQKETEQLQQKLAREGAHMFTLVEEGVSLT
jgi:hypothetical protein